MELMIIYVLWKEARLFMKNAPKSCTYVEFEKNYHELHHDKDREGRSGSKPLDMGEYN